jgi:hypothetical protein
MTSSSSEIQIRQSNLSSFSSERKNETISQFNVNEFDINQVLYL